MLPGDDREPREDDLPQVADDEAAEAEPTQAPAPAPPPEAPVMAPQHNADDHLLVGIGHQLAASGRCLGILGERDHMQRDLALW